MHKFKSFHEKVRGKDNAQGGDSDKSSSDFTELNRQHWEYATLSALGIKSHPDTRSIFILLASLVTESCFPSTASQQSPTTPNHGSAR